MEQDEAIQRANDMNQTFRDMEMRGTRISMKIGVKSVEGSMLSGEETDELDRFHQMSLPQKRAYIS